jgi:hypothetical protein
MSYGCSDDRARVEQRLVAADRAGRCPRRVGGSSALLLGTKRNSCEWPAGSRVPSRARSAPRRWCRRACRRRRALHRHVFVRDRLHHVGAGDEHVARLAHHVDEVGDGRRIHRAAGAGAEDGRDLRNHARGHRVAQEDVGVAAERDDALLDARTARVVEADHGRAVAQREVHDLADLGRVRLGERAAEDGEVLREHVDEAAVDAAVAGDDAVAVDGRLPFAERVAGGDEAVELDERALVEQHVEPFAGRELALGVLGREALGAAPLFCGDARTRQPIEFLAHGHGGRS